MTLKRKSPQETYFNIVDLDKPTKTISAKVTPKERHLIKSLASRKGMELSSYIRLTISDIARSHILGATPKEERTYPRPAGWEPTGFARLLPYFVIERMRRRINPFSLRLFFHQDEWIVLQKLAATLGTSPSVLAERSAIMGLDQGLSCTETVRKSGRGHPRKDCPDRS